ncbi:MAG: CARDB domain-containing protein [Methanomassiliicoccales archaeon]
MVQAENPLYIKVEGRNVVAVREVNPYVVTAIGGPAEVPGGGNYSFLVTVTGRNAVDALVSPANGVTPTGIFRFNLTAPSSATDMTITVNVTSTGPSGKVSKIYNYYVRSVEPIVISAKVVNQGSIEVEGVAVRFFADGVLLQEKKVDIPAGASKVVTYNWTESVSPGEHRIRVELDPQGQFVRFESGGTIFEQTIWVGGTDWANFNAILIGLIILLGLLAYLVYKRPTTKRRRR